ncbi:MAG: DUF917 domain-containing protein [Lysobacterales bacterium]
MRLTLDDVDDYAMGAALMGTGGGGDPYIGSLLLKQSLQTSGPLDLLQADDIPDDALLLVSAMIGAPTVMMEKLPSGDEAIASVRALESYLGKKAHAILAAEIGGLNALLPLVVGSSIGLPVIDGDGMGRAFPELQMVTYSIEGNPSTPLTLTDEFGNTVLIEAKDDATAEKFARSTVVAMGASALMACYPMTGAQVKASILRGTLSVALGVGRAIRQARQANEQPVHRLLDHLAELDFSVSARLLFEGKIVDLLRETTAGFAVGTIELTGLSNAQDQMQIKFQNENLVALHNGEVCAIVPDLICIVDHETAEPITTEGLRYGQRVAVLGIAAPSALRTEKALRVVGPSKFGLKYPFVPLEDTVAVEPGTARRTP